MQTLINNILNASRAEAAPLIVVGLDDLKKTMKYLDQQARQEFRKEMEAPHLVTRKEALTLLNVSATTLHRWTKTGYITPVKVGAKTLYRSSEINAIINGGAPEAPADNH